MACEAQRSKDRALRDVRPRVRGGILRRDSQRCRDGLRRQGCGARAKEMEHVVEEMIDGTRAERWDQGLQLSQMDFSGPV